MLFRQIDLTELQTVSKERAEKVGRIDAGLKATLAATTSFNQTTIPMPKGEPAVTAAEGASLLTEPGEAVAARLTAAVGQVIKLRQEITAGEQMVATRQGEVEAALKAKKASIRSTIRNTLRVGAFMLLVELLRHCTR